MTKPSFSLLVFGLVVTAAVLGIYLPGWNNELLFDDRRLTDGSIFGIYGGLTEFKLRMLSYGSFVWVDALFGPGWGKQRLVNIVLHLGTVAALYAFLRELLAHTKFPEEFEAQPHFGLSRTAALRVGVALFAVNPVAVYAVAYLMQRSILMATLFAVLACWFFVRGLTRRCVYAYGLALLSYVLAVLSKEYAVMLAAMAVPLYIYIRRPCWKTIATIAGVALALLLGVSAVFFSLYGGFIGKLFDARSIALAAQLEPLRPGITAQIYPLSILNEAALFFAYGFLWFVPNVLWMSLDLRPAFPLSFLSWPQTLGALAYVLLLAAAVWALLRRRGALQLVALCLLFPLLLYVTEFATVWVQDPFVLYRSYLWAIAVPGLIAVALTGLLPRTLYIAGAVVGIVFSLLALERVTSLRDGFTVWSDAAEKVDRQAPANVVGRARPFMNLGAYHLDRGSLAQAEKEFAIASTLGDLAGEAPFNMGLAQQKQNKHTEALIAFQRAEERGSTGMALHFHRGESALALGQFALAYKSFDASLQALPETALDAAAREDMQQALQLRRAEAALSTQQYNVAASDFAALLQKNPGSVRLLLGLGTAQVGQGDTRSAFTLFNNLLADNPSGAAFYSRAMAYDVANQRAASLKDLDQAIALEPNNAHYRQARAFVASKK